MWNHWKSPSGARWLFPKSIKLQTWRLKIAQVHLVTSGVNTWLWKPNSSLPRSPPRSLLSEPLSCQHEVIVWSQPSEVISLINKSHFLFRFHISPVYPECPTGTAVVFRVFLPPPTRGQTGKLASTPFAWKLIFCCLWSLWQSLTSDQAGGLLHSHKSTLWWVSV